MSALNWFISTVSISVTNSKIRFGLLESQLLYVGKSFKSKILVKDERNQEKIIFSTISEYIKYEDYDRSEIQYLITRDEEILSENINKEREEVKLILNKLEEDRFLKELRPLEEN
jgi:hypothetical protein